LLRRKFRYLSYLLQVQVVGIIFIILFLSATQAVYANEFELEGEEMGLKVKGETPLFGDLENLAPGQSREASLTVMNQGEHEFMFSITCELFSGDEALYRVLEIEVLGKEEAYYQGGMEGLEDEEIAPLAPGEEKELELEVFFPTGSGGSELQGRSAELDFRFAAYPVQGEKHLTESGVEDVERDKIAEVPPEAPEVPPKPAEEIPQPPEINPELSEVVPDPPQIDPEMPEMAYPDIDGERLGTVDYLRVVMPVAALLFIVGIIFMVRRRYSSR